MKCSSLSLRAFNTGGFFELRLPNGKTILIDPCFSHLDPITREWTTQYETGHTREDIGAADYILLTHTHWDHDLDIGYFVEKYGSLVFCSHACAEELLKYHKIPYDKIVCCYPGSRYTLDDFTLEVLQGKHNPEVVSGGCCSPGSLLCSPHTQRGSCPPSPQPLQLLSAPLSPGRRVAHRPRRSPPRQPFAGPGAARLVSPPGLSPEVVSARKEPSRVVVES